MRMRRGRPERFVSIPNETVDDAHNLDLTQLGLLTVMLRHRDGWQFTLAEIGSKYGYGEDAMSTAMGGLQVARYVVKVRIQDHGNRWSTDVIVFDTPATNGEIAELLATISAQPDVKSTQVIAPTTSALTRAKKRQAKLSTAPSRSAQRGYRLPNVSHSPELREEDETAGRSRLRETPESGTSRHDAAKPQVVPDSGVTRDSGNPGVFKKTVSKKTMQKTAAAVDLVPHQRATEFSAAESEDNEAIQQACEALEGLPLEWRPDVAMATDLAPEVADRLRHGWTPELIRWTVTRNPNGLRNPVAALPARVRALPLNPPRKAGLKPNRGLPEGPEIQALSSQEIELGGNLQAEIRNRRERLHSH